MLDRLVEFLRSYTTANAGQGPSSTKLIWLTAGLASVYCATLATLGGVSVYVFQERADNTYWLGVGALWVNALGFAAQVMRGQHQAAKEISIAQASASGPGTPDQEGKP